MQTLQFGIFTRVVVAGGTLVKERLMLTGALLGGIGFCALAVAVKEGMLAFAGLVLFVSANSVRLKLKAAKQTPRGVSLMGMAFKEHRMELGRLHLGDHAELSGPVPDSGTWKLNRSIAFEEARMRVVLKLSKRISGQMGFEPASLEVVNQSGVRMYSASADAFAGCEGFSVIRNGNQLPLSSDTLAGIVEPLGEVLLGSSFAQPDRKWIVMIDAGGNSTPSVGAATMLGGSSLGAAAMVGGAVESRAADKRKSEAGMDDSDFYSEMVRLEKKYYCDFRY